MVAKLLNWLHARWHGLGWAVRGWLASVHRLIDPHWTGFQRVLALRRNKQQEFHFELAVCSIFRNEARFLDEWLTLHHAVGVEHFYLYNDQSTDGFREVLAPWVRRGIVTLIEWDHKRGQAGAYNNCIRRFRKEARWIAFIDLDEFLFSPRQTNVREVLQRYRDAPAVFVYWVMFGSNGHKTHPAAPVIESYTRCLELNVAKASFPWAKEGKSIVNPRLIRKYDVHKPTEIWRGELVDENFREPQQRLPHAVDISCDNLRINHYFIKSMEDLRLKNARGNWHWKRSAEELFGIWTEMDQHLNSAEDKTLLGIWRATCSISPVTGHACSRSLPEPESGWLDPFDDKVTVATLLNWLHARWRGLGWAARGWLDAGRRWSDPHWTGFQRVLALRRNRRRHFRHELCACTMFRNEARYFDEWITLHRAVGVEHFYLYNNQSTDSFREVLAPWIKRGIVTLLDWDREGGQVGAFNDCIRRFRMEARWIAFLDVDEFLFSPEAQDLREVLPRYEGYPAIFVYWILFGSGGHVKRPTGSIIENFTRCLDLETAKSDEFRHGDALRERDTYVTGWAKDGKSIANPRLVKKYFVHQPQQVWEGVVIDEKFRPHLRRMPGTVDLSCSVLRINHYWSKSIEDIRFKVLKGNACWDNKPNAKLDRWLEREQHLNRTHDDTLLRIWQGLTADADRIPIP